MSDEMKARGLLSRANAIRSSGMSESSFDRLNLEPVERRGRQTFYSIRQIVEAELIRYWMKSPTLEALRKVSPKAAEAAARQMAQEALQ